VGPEAGPFVSAIAGACDGSAAFTLGSSSYLGLTNSVLDRIERRHERGEYQPVSYQQDSTVTTSSNGFEVDLSGSIGISAKIGGGIDFLEAKEAVVEQGAWIAGENYPTETYDTIPEVPVEYKIVVRRMLTGIDDAIWNAALTLWDALTPPFGNSAIAQNGAIDYQIGDNGTTVRFSEGTIPSSLDSLWAVSWGWWGASVNKRPSSLDPKARRIMTATKQAAEETFGMRYGIGGFYELQPEGTGLQGQTTLTIHYSEEELDGIEEEELAVYWEDALDER